MPKGIQKSDWDIIHQIACDIANATMINDDTLASSRTQEMLASLEDLRKKYGDHPSLLATTADYLEDESERLQLYRRALKVARELNDAEEIREISDSINELEHDADANQSAT